MTIRIGKASDNDYVITESYISRYHARLIRDGDSLYIEDAGSTNGVFVNGDRVMRRRLTGSDVVILGESYRLDIAEVLKFDNDYSAEFALLKDIYENYTREKIRIQSSNQFKTRLFQSLPFVLIGVVGLVIGIAGRDNHTLLIISLLLAICIPTVGVYMGARQSSKIPKLLQESTNRFKIDYVCPKCGTFLGELPWESLANRRSCPIATCRAKWVSD
jgi:hypothetical protein